MRLVVVFDGSAQVQRPGRFVDVSVVPEPESHQGATEATQKMYNKYQGTLEVCQYWYMDYNNTKMFLSTTHIQEISGNNQMAKYLFI